MLYNQKEQFAMFCLIANFGLGVGMRAVDQKVQMLDLTTTVAPLVEQKAACKNWKWHSGSNLILLQKFACAKGGNKEKKILK